MQPEIPKYLYDIRQACRLLMQFTEGKAYDDYLGNALLRSAVERQFTIIGEALLQALKIEPDLAGAITHTRRIINFRHVLVHGYAQIDHKTVWGVLQDDLTMLLCQVEALLAKSGPEP